MLVPRTTEALALLDLRGSDEQSANPGPHGEVVMEARNLLRMV
jgi:hypothetical protein